MELGVREFKEHLSAYLDRAAAGERLIVTDRGRPRVVVGPLPGGDDLQRGIQEGWIRAPLDDGAPPPPPSRAGASVSIASSLSEDRGA